MRAANPVHQRFEFQPLWTPLPALPGGRRGPAFRPSERELRRRLRDYYLRRLRQDAPQRRAVA
ncbi:MAG: hypothetical protein HYY03_05070 [Chloroflexi bacterium]|nr:hypothetical protein [Chloroflexota bacterium]